MENENLAGVLSEFARTMVTDFPIQGILDHFVKRIVDILPVSAAGVTLITPGLEPRYVAASDSSALRFEQLQTDLGEGPCLAAYHSGEAISVPDLNNENRFPAFAPRALEAGLVAVFTFPLYHGASQLGALDLYRDTPGPLSQESMASAQTLADVAAAYLINAQARSDLQDSSDKSRDAALHDGLTGLPNRVLMLNLLEHAFRQGKRTGKTAAVLFVDLDGFKDVNDSHGHHVGDELLIAVAERLAAVLRPGDTLARLFGDEFVVLCEALDDPAEAEPIGARFDVELRRPFHLSSGEVNITASIGVAFTGRGGSKPVNLLHDADAAMYRTKRRRAGGRHFFDLREVHLAGLPDELARGLPGAVERGELQIEYQPIVAAFDGQISGMEALLRWNHPSRGVVPPGSFIPMAEQSGQIVEIGRWMLEQVWSDEAAWHTDRASRLGVAINVSTHQLMSAGFAGSVGDVLDSASINPALLMLEVTESVFVRDEERARIVLNELKGIGVKLALDDFGTGYSSLSYLNALPIDTIKIDQTFIAKLMEDPGSESIVNAIIQLAHNLDLTVVAEGVETMAQHEALTELGSDACQGFYFARPMPAHRVAGLIQRQDAASKPHLPEPLAA
jgi:diguanylate cyclase (GGDEF)-like protein